MLCPTAVVNQLCSVMVLVCEVQVVVQMSLQTFVHDHAERVLVCSHLVHTLSIVSGIARDMRKVMSASIIV